MQVAILVLSAISLAVGLTVLVLSIRNDRRSRERTDVRWAIDRVEQGQFRCYNAGVDTAYGVRVEMRTHTEEVIEDSRKVEPRGFVEVVLPRRADGEVEPVDVPFAYLEDDARLMGYRDPLTAPGT
jgi:hypothetical protein